MDQIGRGRLEMGWVKLKSWLLVVGKVASPSTKKYNGMKVGSFKENEDKTEWWTSLSDVPMAVGRFQYH